MGVLFAIERHIVAHSRRNHGVFADDDQELLFFSANQHFSFSVSGCNCILRICARRFGSIAAESQSKQRIWYLA